MAVPGPRGLSLKLIKMIGSWGEIAGSTSSQALGEGRGLARSESALLTGTGMCQRKGRF